MSVRILTLTDHINHKDHESLYPLLRRITTHPECAAIDVASRSTPGNESFFGHDEKLVLKALEVDEDFTFEKAPTRLQSVSREVDITEYDFLFMRLPKPNAAEFFYGLEKKFDPSRILNRPSGILKTGSKAFLESVPELCPPVKLCYSIKEVEVFASKFPIVLKPLFEAGGKGILRIDKDKVWEGEEIHSYASFLPTLKERISEGMIAMEFLRHNDQGDKRIVVCNGKVVASALRLPGPGNWLCNVAQGGSSVASDPDPDEQHIADTLSPILKDHGIILFGFDTLMGNHGKRVLSEINASCPGGIWPAEVLTGKPVIQETSDLLMAYFLSYQK